MVSDTILIADSGSTKTEWRLASVSNSSIGSCTSNGINPFYQTTGDILESLKAEFKINNCHPKEVFFYGAGCANTEKNAIVKVALLNYFETENITINSDLLGAARSLCQHKNGIACILGTGSNSCYYNGNDIVKNISPLGFIIGDEGSGAVMGKILIGNILKNQLPTELIKLFFEEYNTNANEIVNHIYKKPFPNRYLAQYTKFISKHIHHKALEQMVLSCFNDFITRNVLQYDNVENLEISFTGSIAFYFKEQLKKTMDNFGLKLGNINPSPMEGIVNYHQSL